MSRTLELMLNPKLELVAPDFILDEFMEHKDEISLKSNLSYSQLLASIILLSNRVNFISLDNYKDCLLEAARVSPDKDDIDYIALAINLNCSIWSNDKGLKDQKRISIYSTEELQNYLKLV